MIDHPIITINAKPLIPMNPLTALCFILFHLEMLVCWNPKYRIPRGIFVIVSMALCVLNLMDIYSVIPLEPDHWIFHDRTLQYNSHMSPNTSFAMLFLGTSILTIKRHSWYIYLGQYLVGLTLTIALMAFLGHIYEVSRFYVINSNLPMALLTSIALLCSGWSILLSNARLGLINNFIGKNEGALVAKITLPFAIIIPIILGLLFEVSHKLNIFSAESGVTLMVLIMIIVFVLLISINAQLLNKRDRERLLAEFNLQKLNETLESKVQERTAALNQSLKEIADYKYALDVSSLVSILNAKGRIIDVNENFCHISGYNREELIGQNFKLLSKDLIDGASFTDIWKQISLGNLWQGEIRSVKKNGEYFWVYKSIVPFLNSDGIPYQYLIIRNDITENKKLELERITITNDLIQRNKQLEQFAYIVSHNLRSPVANIFGLSQLLSDKSLDIKQEEEIKGELLKSVQRLDDVVRDLNLILQIKRGISEAHEQVIFSELVSNICESISKNIEETNFTIQTDFTSVDELETVKSYLYSIFYNLITNAIKYRNRDLKSELKISSKKEGNHLIILFEDNGLGIDMIKHKEHIFGLYKRFHTNIDGKGVGLYIVKTQVESLGGEISIKSEINKGTTFKIIFKQ